MFQIKYLFVGTCRAMCVKVKADTTTLEMRLVDAGKHRKHKRDRKPSKPKAFSKE
jgi:hypothetical protein